MTKKEILEYFKDINHVYNESTRYDELNRMLDELTQLCEDSVLDDIRAEIENEYDRLSVTRADETLELGECLGLKMALKIFDKHKEESEGKE